MGEVFAVLGGANLLQSAASRTIGGISLDKGMMVCYNIDNMGNGGAFRWDFGFI